MRNPISLEAFADWCAKQPVEGEYNYTNIYGCACAQYAATLGLNGASVGQFPEWLRPFDVNGKFWRTANRIAYDRPHTFGSLTERLRSAIAGGA